jgi:putative glutamine amidotransferase
MALGLTYMRAVELAGGVPVVLPPLEAGAMATLLTRLDGVCLSGGPDLDPAGYGARAHEALGPTEPALDRFELELARAADAAGMPLLGICRGAQALNVARGGTLHQHIADDPGVPAHGQPGVAGGARRHEVTLDKDSLVADVMGATTVTASCHHHQAIAKLGDGLRVVGRAHDKIVEALELDGQFLLAVQWHPEDTADEDPAQQRLFDALVRKAGG